MSEQFPMWGPPHVWTIPELPAPKRADRDTEPAAIDGATFRTIRAALGLTTTDIAMWLQIAPRTVQRWDTRGLPEWAIIEVDALVQYTTAWVDRLAAGAEARIYPEATIDGRRTSGWRVLPDGRVLPESWWLTVVGRAAMRLPSLAVTWGQ